MAPSGRGSRLTCNARLLRRGISRFQAPHEDGDAAGGLDGFRGGGGGTGGGAMLGQVGADVGGGVSRSQHQGVKRAGWWSELQWVGREGEGRRKSCNETRRQMETLTGAVSARASRGPELSPHPRAQLGRQPPSADRPRGSFPSRHNGHDGLLRMAGLRTGCLPVFLYSSCSPRRGLPQPSCSFHFVSFLTTLWPRSVFASLLWQR